LLIADSGKVKWAEVLRVKEHSKDIRVKDSKAVTSFRNESGMER
jgi:hypothetical protein